MLSCLCVSRGGGGGGGTGSGHRRLRDAASVLRLPYPAAGLHGDLGDLQGGHNRHRDRHGRGPVVAGQGSVLAGERLPGAGADPRHDHLSMVRAGLRKGTKWRCDQTHNSVVKHKWFGVTHARAKSTCGDVCRVYDGVYFLAASDATI